MSNVSVSVQTTMTSLELVEFINSEREAGDAELRHDSFMAKVPKVLGGVQNLLDTYVHPQNGQTYPCYRFQKREACLMAMSYSYELQAKVFDRMTALEIQSAKTTPMIESPPLVDTCNALVASVEAKVLSKKEGAELIRAITLASFHGADVLMAASKPKAVRKALIAPVQAALTNGDSVAYALRAQGTMSATDLLREHGSGVSAKSFYELLEKPDMVITRHELKSQVSYRVLIGEGLQYGQNVMTFEGTRSNPYFYVSKFAELLERIGSLVAVETEAVPKPTETEKLDLQIMAYKKTVIEAWKYGGREIDEETCVTYVSRAALLKYLIDNGKNPKTAKNMLAPLGTMMRILGCIGFLRSHNDGWLIAHPFAHNA